LTDYQGNPMLAASKLILEKPGKKAMPAKGIAS
jgi:hypothetical protein